MFRSQRASIFGLVAMLLALALSANIRADTLTITSQPPGAAVEIEGLVSGTTPSHTELPSGYFHKPHMAFNARLEHPMVVRVSKEGYAPRFVTLTEGPFEWVAITGKRHGNYFLLKSDHFDIKLSQAAETDEIGTGHERPGPISKTTEADVAAPRAKAPSGTVTITTGSSGLDIYVDDKFVGQTPSTLSLDAGNHHIDVKNSTGNTWSRDLTVLPNSQINLRPDFTGH